MANSNDRLSLLLNKAESALRRGLSPVQQQRPSTASPSETLAPKVPIQPQLKPQMSPFEYAYEVRRNMQKVQQEEQNYEQKVQSPPLKKRHHNYSQILEMAYSPSNTIIIPEEPEIEEYQYSDCYSVYSTQLPIEDKLQNIQKRYQAKIEYQRRLKEQREMENFQPTPNISKRSQKLVPEYYSSLPVYQRLFAKAQVKQSIQKESENFQAMEAKLRSNPVITQKAKNLKREGDIVSRLMEYQQKYKEKLNEKIQQSVTEESTVKPYVDVDQLVSRLTTKNVKEKQYHEEFSFKPQLSNRSRKLVSKLGYRQERLTNGSVVKEYQYGQCITNFNTLYKMSKNLSCKIKI